MISYSSLQQSASSTPTSSILVPSSWRRISRKECCISTIFLTLFTVAVVVVVVFSGSGGSNGSRNVTLEEDMVVTTPSMTVPVSTAPNNSNSSFSVMFAILPDTQYYSEGAPYIYKAQTQWLVDHVHDIGDNLFVMHLGDVVQSSWGNAAEAQWQAASETMSLLEMANISYSIMSGNHDLKSPGWDIHRNHSNEDYLQYFGPQRDAARHSTTLQGRDPLGYSEYHYVVFTSSSSSIPVVDAEQQEQQQQQQQAFIVMALDWRASNETLAWVNNVLDKYPHVPIILTSHEYLTLPWDYDYNNNESDSYYVYRTDYGDSLWNGFVAARNEFFLVLCGHISGTGYRIDDNVHGQPVVSVLIDYQSMHAGGNGYLRLMEFNLLQGTMEHLTLSPFVLDLYNNNLTKKTTADDYDTTLGPHDYAELTDPSNKYIIPFNFQKRFHQMQNLVGNSVDPEEESASTFLPLSSSSSKTASLLDPVRAMLKNIPLPPKMDDKPRPSDSSDYVNVTDSTLAHWRFDHEHVRHDGYGNKVGVPQQQQEHDDTLADTVIGIVKDLSGHGNDLIRQSTNDLLENETNYLTWSTDHHPLSASAGSICFSNPTRDSGSFLVTIPGASAPLDTESFRHTGGYTIEAFVRLADTWEYTDAHRWSGVVSRVAEGQDTGRPTEGDSKEPLVVLGFSELAEAQFAAFPDMLLQDPETIEAALPPSSSYLRAGSHDGIGLNNDTTPTRLITAWSSPLRLGQWYHIAAVNTNGQTTRLYIDGYPARRDPIHDDGHVFGIATPAVNVTTYDNKGGWSIGSSSYDGRRKVFGGCIGEVRIVGRALAPDEFLMSRRSAIPDEG